jgi:predicted O-methyltransferase YrrM
VASALESSRVSGVLERLRVLAEEQDGVYSSRVRAREAELGGKLYGPERAAIGARAPLAVAPEVGRILYGLVIATRPRLVVEFGASFGFSTLHLAAALDDLGAGELITTELIEEKARVTAENLEAAGLAARVEIRQGDALGTLEEIDTPIDLLFLDGSNDLYVEVLQMLESRLSLDALIVADLSHGDPHHVRYRDYVRDPERGYLSVEIPIDAGLIVSTRR